jgi:hypothetical protein
MFFLTGDIGRVIILIIIIYGTLLSIIFYLLKKLVSKTKFYQAKIEHKSNSIEMLYNFGILSIGVIILFLINYSVFFL